MSVREREWKDAQGRTHLAWIVDVDFEHADGRRQRVVKTSPVQTRRGAERYEQQLREALLTGTYGVKPCPTLAEFLPDFLTFARNNNTPSTVEAKRGILQNHLVPFFGSMRLDAIGPGDVERYKEAKAGEGFSAKAIHNQLTHLQAAANLCREYRGQSERVTFRKPSVRQPAPDFLTFEQKAAFVAAASADVAELACVFALDTGLRSGELRALRWIDISEAGANVQRQVWRGHEGDTKQGKAHAVPLNANARAVLARLPRTGSHVFGELSASALERACERLAKRAGVGEVTPHTLRHTFASHLVMRGASLKEVQTLMGHASITMTMRYAHLAPGRTATAVQLLEAAAP